MLNGFDFAQFFHIAGALKIGLLTTIVLYIVFLFVVFKQVKSMNAIITETFFSTLLSAIAFIFLLFGIALLVIAIIIV